MPENLLTPNTSSSKKVIPLALDLSLHKYQTIIEQCRARFVYLMCGRQFGKTMLLALRMTQSIIKPNSSVWYLTNQLKQAKDTVWPKLLEILSPSKKNFRAVEADLEIVFNNNSKIALKHMKDPDCRRGPSLTRLCVDEAQDFDGDEFESVFRPLLAAKQAPCDFSGTLKYGSWFHNEWLAAEEGRIKDAAAFWFPSTANPLIPSTEWDDVKKELSRKNRMDIWDNEYICDPHQKATGD